MMGVLLGDEHLPEFWETKSKGQMNSDMLCGAKRRRRSRKEKRGFLSTRCDGNLSYFSLGPGSRAGHPSDQIGQLQEGTWHKTPACRVGRGSSVGGIQRCGGRQ